LERYKFSKYDNNLSLFTLPAILNETGVDDTEISGRIKKLETKFQKEIEYRKKYLAHFDLP
jgi:hypothetical protein